LPTPRRVLDFPRQLRRGHGGQRGGNADRPFHRLWPNRTRRLPSVSAAGGALAQHSRQVAPGLCGREVIHLEPHPGTTWRCWLLGGVRCRSYPGQGLGECADGERGGSSPATRVPVDLLAQGPTPLLRQSGRIWRSPSQARNVPSGRIAPISEATSLSCLAVTLAPVRSAPLRLAL
jgi:hypothetical protein